MNPRAMVPLLGALSICACKSGPATAPTQTPTVGLLRVNPTGSILPFASSTPHDIAASVQSVSAPPASNEPHVMNANMTPATDASNEGVSSAGQTRKTSPPVKPQLGRIVCGNTSCRTGQEICCRSDPPDEANSICVPVTQEELADYAALDGLCDARGALLVTCDESVSCGTRQTCCENLWGSGQNEPIFCSKPRPGERFPCVFREPCVPGVPCRTADAQCVKGWCAVKRPNRPLHCGNSTCSPAKPVCCGRGKNKHLECAAEGDCEWPPDNPYYCTRPSDCGPGEFCDYGSCVHSPDVSPRILCDTLKDCPRALLKVCTAFGNRLACSPADVADDLLLAGRRICRCQ